MLKSKILLSSFLVSLLFLLIGWSVAFVNLGEVRHLLVIHFSDSGASFLGSKWDVYGVLLMGLILNLLNGLLAVFFYYRDRFSSHLLGLGNLLASSLILVVVFAIIAVN